MSDRIWASDKAPVGGINAGRPWMRRIKGLSSGLPGTTAGPETPPLDQVFAPVQAQSGKWRRRLGAVAFIAATGQQGADLFFEEFQGGGIRRRGQSNGQAYEKRGTRAQARRKTLHD